MMIFGGLRLDVRMYPLSGRHRGALCLWGYVPFDRSPDEENICKNSSHKVV
jgi:hypothetical protein